MADQTTTEALAPIDVDALGNYLDGPHGAVRAHGRELLADPEFAPPDPEISTGEYRELVFEWAKKLADAKQTTIGFPSEYGGGESIAASIAAFETLAYGDLSLLVKTGVQFGLFGGAILHLGTRRHHEKYLRDVISLELPGAFAMSESAHGSDVQSVGTRATYDPDTQEFVVHTPQPSDRKDWIGNAAEHGRMAAVFAQLVVGDDNHGVHCLLVPIRDEKGKPAEGVTIEDCGHKIGLNGVDNGRLYFDNVRIPRENLLDRYGTVSEDGEYSSPIENPTRRFFTMVGTLVQGRISVGGGAITVSKSALVTAIRHGLGRRQFGPPDGGEEVVLLDYRAHQRRLFPRLAKTYALHFIQGEMVRDLDRIFSGTDRDEEARRELESRAAGVKAIATWHAVDCIQTGREACGGLGYLSTSHFGARKADAEIFTTFEGDNTVLLQLVAKSMLTGYREDFGELNSWGMAQFVANTVVERFAERSAARELFGRIWDDITPSSEEEDDLLDRDYQQALFAWREEHILEGAARRLKRGIDDGHDAFDVFNACQDHVLLAARAHVDTQVLEAFCRGIEECKDDNARAALSKVCDLYAVSTIEQNRDWYQEHGRISSTRSKAAIRMVNRLCEELRPHAFELAQALRVPDAVLPEFGPDGIVS